MSSDLQALSREPAKLSEPDGVRALKKALTGRDRLEITSAAKLIAEHTLGEHAVQMATTFRELSTARASADPGCLAKEALLVALDAVEHQDAELFADAAWHMQLEKVKGGMRDSAGRVRARAVLALARVGHTDLLPIFGARLADEDPNVRLAAATAIAHRGDRNGAGLLLLKLGAGDSVEAILVECLRGLFVVAVDLAAQQANAMLRNPRLREQALSALGAAASERAVELLRGELERSGLASERRPVIEALSVSRRSSARDLLLELLRANRESDAEAALEALAIHRYDARLVERVREATAGSETLSQRFSELYE